MPNLDPWRSRYRRWNCRCLCQTEWHLQRHFCGACQGAGTFLKGNCWQKLKLNVTSWIPPDIGRQTEKVDSALLPSTSANSLTISYQMQCIWMPRHAVLFTPNHLGHLTSGKFTCDEIAAHEWLGQLCREAVLCIPDGVALTVKVLPEMGDCYSQSVLIRVLPLELIQDKWAREIKCHIPIKQRFR